MLEEDEEEHDLPSSWRTVDEESDDDGEERARDAAVARGVVRGDLLRENIPSAEAGAPQAREEEDDDGERDAGADGAAASTTSRAGRMVRRPSKFF